MNAERLLTLYDRVADSPDSVSRLRRFVLDLAVRGRLVEQDPADEPASELLKRLAAEKARLVSAGKIRKPPHFANGRDWSLTFEVPVSWCWCRLDAVGAVIGGGTPSATDHSNFAEPGEGIPWLTPADLGGHEELYIERGLRDLSKTGLQSSSATIMPFGTVLFTSRAPIGYVAIAANPIATNQGFKSIVPYVTDCSRFVALALQAFSKAIDSIAPGTTFKEVSGKLLSAVPFPLPPLAEQHRIVAKVDELMEVMTKLEDAQAARETTRARLTSASFDRLRRHDTDPAEFHAHAQFAINSLPNLTACSSQLKLLRSTLLDLALRGKLSKRRLSDKPPDETLSAIRLERDAVVNSLGLRLTKPPPPIMPQDEPFVIPDSWAWVRLGHLALYTQYGTSSKAKVSELGIPVLTMGNIKDGRIVRSTEKRLPLDSDEFPKLLLKRFDLLYNRTNSAELVGKTGIYLEEDDCATFASYLIRIQLSISHSSPRFVNFAMNAPVFRETQIVPHIKKQTGQANVNGSVMRNMIIPLPPHEEQKRIVAKLDGLMAFCQKLEVGILKSDDAIDALIDCELNNALA